MRAVALFMALIVLAALSTDARGQSIPFDITSFGAMLQPSSYGSPGDYLPMAAQYSAFIPTASFFMPSDFGGYTGFLPEMSAFGSPAMSGLSGLSLPGLGTSGISMLSPLGFPDMQIPAMLQQPDVTGLGTGSQGAAPIATDNYTESSNGKTIRVKAGDTIHVQLPARIDQGYTWNLSVTQGLNVTGQRMYAPKQVDSNLGAGIIGLLSTQEWDIQALEPGAQTVTGIYKRSWESGIDDKTYTLTVIVE